MHLVHQMAGDLGQHDRIVVHDRDGVAGAHFGGDRLTDPFAHGLLERLANTGVHAGRITPPKPLTSPLRHRAAVR